VVTIGWAIVDGRPFGRCRTQSGSGYCAILHLTRQRCSRDVLRVGINMRGSCADSDARRARSDGPKPDAIHIRSSLYQTLTSV
jgi:hypothetical protein